MPLIKYSDRVIRKSGLDLIEQVNDIVSEFYKQGYSVTLRQVYYQLVTKNAIENSDRSYKRLGELVSNGRLAGLIDWHAIEDRTRFIRGAGFWEDPQDFLQNVAGQYRIDLWEGQPYHVEVWVEKDALIGIVEQASATWGVPCLSCRGYVSQSEMWQSAQRIIEKVQEGKKAVILHLGDHDPSGIDMTRDIRERLNMFGADAEVERIALNMDQVEGLRLPPNPAKITDTRAQSYTKTYGPNSWELDALQPTAIVAMISLGIRMYLDKTLFDAKRTRQTEEQNMMKNAKIVRVE